MRDGTKTAAVAAAASEETCIVIGVDADGTVRVGQFRNWGEMSSSFAPRSSAWLEATIGKIVAESVYDAQPTAGATCRAPYQRR